MAQRSPKHHLTKHSRGWVKSINGDTKWICSLKAAPSGRDADAVYERRMSDYWAEPPPPEHHPSGELTVKALADLWLARKKALVAPKILSSFYLSPSCLIQT
jgi:hypothetical protein